MDNQTDNPDNYRWGIIYFNRKDKRIIVPKQDPYRGFTLNFANPLAWAIVAGLIVIILGANFLI